MKVIPCPRCGYDAPTSPCAFCGGAPRDPSFERTGSELGAGFQAFVRGLYFLGSTSRTKRWLVPPLAATSALFIATFVLLERLLSGWIDALRQSANAELAVNPEWLKHALEWFLSSAALWWILQLGGFAVVAIAMFFAAVWTFSIVYEALAGPFLDVVHARIEARWFGIDPRSRLDGGSFAQRLARQGATIATSLQATLLAFALLVVCLPLKFVPLFGWLLFGAAAGFCTAISLFDIPFSRREWSLGQRVRFLRAHFGAVVAFGATAALVFVIPFVGPAVCVPAASVGALWLVCRLDKNPLRPLDRPWTDD